VHHAEADVAVGVKSPPRVWITFPPTSRLFIVRFSTLTEFPAAPFTRSPPYSPVSSRSSAP
jgi:hypothetical protein